MSLTLKQLMDLADSLAFDIVAYANEHGVSGHDILMATAISERLVQSSVSGGDLRVVLAALQEADATFKAILREQEPN